ncbi:MAG TPA: DUF503 domain-containing protein [Candidatus Tectomicrobia bacterium]|nr:DUF503 domain-containing protein [Candidatus Tectomicrobia bacterium]
MCTIDLRIPGIDSLKGKRSVVRKIKERVKNTFNVSIAEVEDLDKLQRVGLGIAFVSNDSKHIHSTLSKVVNFIDHMYVADIIDYHIEVW